MKSFTCPYGVTLTSENHIEREVLTQLFNYLPEDKRRKDPNSDKVGTWTWDEKEGVLDVITM